jgi:PAS domain S-box-containing protein
MIGGTSLGALLFFHRSVDHFSPNQLDLIQAAANQVAIAVNNAELYTLIRDQAEDLGKMVRNQQVETQRTKAILEDVADGVLVTDENMKITLFNNSSEKVLGLDRSQVIGKSLEHFTGLFGKAAHTWMETVRKWSQNPGSYNPGDIYSEQIKLEDRRVVSVHLAPVSLRETFLGTVSIFRDITHQVEVDRLKSEFVSTVSHELRTPMTSIKGYVDILLMGAAGPLNEQQTHFLDIVKNNAERLAILVNDLLDISRIESGRLKLSLQPIDISPLVKGAVADLIRRTQEENRPMRVEAHLPRKLPRVMGDPDQVRRILDNLLENAYLYTRENGRILLRARPSKEHLQIDIIDNGIGIPIEMQPRVFERFYRGDNPSVLATSGTGLGLSIVQNLVEMQDGKIWLESSGVEGEGSAFSFTLPLYNPQNG